MGQKMNWPRAKQGSRPTEYKGGAGVVLPSGAVTEGAPADGLARRAAREMRKWTETTKAGQDFVRWPEPISRITKKKRRRPPRRSK